MGQHRFPGIVIATTINTMAYEGLHRIQRSKRVFINNVDTYASKFIGKVRCTVILSAEYFA